MIFVRKDFPHFPYFPDKMGGNNFPLKTSFLYYFCYFLGVNGENRVKNKDFRGFHRVPLVSFWGEIGKKANKRTESGKLTKKQRRGGVALSKYNFVYCLRCCPVRFYGRARTRTRGGTGSLKSRYPHYSRPKN